MRCEFEMADDHDHDLSARMAGASRMVNAIPAVCDAKPGLLSALDLATDYRKRIDQTCVGSVTRQSARRQGFSYRPARPGSRVETSASACASIQLGLFGSRPVSRRTSAALT
jgi:hypothetical protein